MTETVSARPTINKRSSKGRIKSSTVAIYTGVFVLLVAIIAIGYRAPQDATTADSTTPVASTQVIDQSAVSDVVATDIAASVANATDLAIAPKVAELAVATRIESEYSTVADNATISKPVIVELSAASRNISTYEVKAGDTVASVAKHFGISETTIRWANNMRDGASLVEGSTINILPVDGIAYTVKDGDTIDKIAGRYKADASAIITYNDLELKGISTGLKIIIPSGELPVTERPGYVAPPIYNYNIGYSAGFSGRTWFIKYGTPMYAGNKYYAGNCTAYAYDRRIELGRPITFGVAWGDARAWDLSAAAAGFKVDNQPEVGAIIQNRGGLGHVAIVEAILPNGDLQLSEMNASVPGGGYNIVSGRILPAAVVSQYAYIH